jgi:exodeoxyribonuclease V beta subunit
MKIMKEFDVAYSQLDGINLIDANAGTGKTYTIEGIFLRLILEKSLSIDQILVVTFTEAATNELKLRIYQKLKAFYRFLGSGVSDLLPEDYLLASLLNSFLNLNSEQKDLWRANLKSAIDSIDEAKIFTIHGFCRRVLNDFSFESNEPFDIELIKNTNPIINEIAENFWRNIVYQKNDIITASVLKYFPTPQALITFFSNTAAHLKINILPDLSIQEIQNEIKAISVHFSKAKIIWLKDRSAISTLLLENPDINRRSYKKELIPAKIDQLNLFFDQFLFSETVLKIFCQNVFKKSEKKGKTLPEVEFFVVFEILYEKLTRFKGLIGQYFIKHCRVQLKQKLNQSNRYSFNDLILNLHDALNRSSSQQLINKVRNQYHAALIDEFQDTDAIQYRIFNLFFGRLNNPLFLIGDPKQSIYQFRGGDVYTYCQAKNSIINEATGKDYSLSTNFRSDNNLITAINNIFTQHQRPFLNDAIDYIPSKASKENALLIKNNKPFDPFQLYYLEQTDGSKKSLNHDLAQTRIVELCASEIVSLLNYQEGLTINHSNLKPDQICVLVKTHLQATLIQQALTIRNVPCVVKSRLNIWETEEYLELLFILEAIAQYQNSFLLKTALATNLLGYSGDLINQIFIDDIGLEKEISKFWIYYQLWNTKGVFLAIKKVIDDFSIKQRLLSTTNGERILTNFLHTLEIFHEAESENHLGLHSLIKWGWETKLQKFNENEKEIRLETDDQAVKIFTIHISKGLEFPVVFCPFSWKPGKTKEVVFHQNDSIYLDLGSNQFDVNKAQSAQESMSEDIRLLYVALTRAKNLVYLFWGDIGKVSDSPLYNLLNLKDPQSASIPSQLQTLFSSPTGHISVKPFTDQEIKYFNNPMSDTGSYICRKYQNRLKYDWSLISYSSLHRSMIINQKDKEFDEAFITSDLILEEPKTPFSLPKGAKIGTCLHEILEEVDFENSTQEIFNQKVSQKLIKYKIDSSWCETITKMLLDLMHVPLINKTSLNQISLSQRIVELEFYFPFSKIDRSKLNQKLLSVAKNDVQKDLVQLFSLMDLSRLNGYMRGFIDMIFKFENKYYIIDWKSNYLGDQLSDYTAEKLKVYMLEHAYHLQYYIYLLALHKYLKYRISDYDFSQHLGGVYYTFLRGIGENHQTGIYVDTLSDTKAFIERLDSLFY